MENKQSVDTEMLKIGLETGNSGDFFVFEIKKLCDFNDVVNHLESCEDAEKVSITMSAYHFKSFIEDYVDLSAKQIKSIIENERK